MTTTPIIGVIGDLPTSAFNRSWIHELVTNPFSPGKVMVVLCDAQEIRDGKANLPYSAILYRMSAGSHIHYEKFMGYIAQQKIPIVIDIDENLDGYSDRFKFPSGTTLVTTTNMSNAVGAARSSLRVLVWGEPSDERLPLENQNVASDTDQPENWLWIVDSGVSATVHEETMTRFSTLTDNGARGSATIVGEVNGFSSPTWAMQLPIPSSIAKLGDDAVHVWLSNFQGRWNSSLWEAGDAWHLSSIYRDLGLQRFVADKYGKVSKAEWPANGPGSDSKRLHQMQRIAISAIFPTLDIDQMVPDIVAFDYDQSGALQRQDLAFPRKSDKRRQPLSPGLPLVSILIPAYNRPEYLIEALESALFQSYDNIEIIIGDDSTTDDVETMIRSQYLNKYPQIKYWRNAHNKGQFQNDLDLIEASTGEYVNILMDDDLLHLDKIRSQMEYFLASDGASVGLVTSHRAVVDADGKFKKLFASTPGLFKSTERLPGRAAIEQSLRTNRNFFGEPTTVLFRKSMLREEFGSLFGRQYVCNVDHSTWLQILQHGDAVFMNEALSAYRLHEGQQSWTPRAALGGAADFAHATLELHARGYLKDAHDFQTAGRKCLQRLEAEQLKITDVGSLDAEELELHGTVATYVAQIQQMLDAD